MDLLAGNPLDLKQLFWSALRITLAVIVIYPVFLSLYLYFFQERLIFLPSPVSPGRLKAIAVGSADVEEINIKTPDGVNLHGWFVKNPDIEISPLLIYFGGNAEEVSGFLYDAPMYRGWSVLAVNYRGYGLSEGIPTEENLFNDALTVYDYITRREDIDKMKIVGMGRSLGTAVAVHLASKRPVKGLILVSPFDSMTRVAKDVYPYLPVSLILRHPFDTLSLAPSINVPMLALAATGDRVVRPRRSRRLAEAWGGGYNLQMIEGKGHETIESDGMYWKSIGDFLDSSLSGGK